MRLWPSLFLALLLVPAALPAAGRAPASSATHAAADSRPSDSEIEQTIRAKLAKSKIGKDGFQVSVKTGVATWQGHTTVMQHKGAATRMAKTAGAIRVVNNIRIDGGTGVGGAPRKVDVKTN